MVEGSEVTFVLAVVAVVTDCELLSAVKLLALLLLLLQLVLLAVVGVELKTMDSGPNES